jgi:hypothetical protein
MTIFFLSACSKSASDLNDVDESAISSVMSMPNESQMRVAYELLKPNEKLVIWKRHIDFFLNEKQMTFEQRNFVQEFRNRWLVLGLFNGDNEVLNKYLKELPKIKEQAQLILGIPDAYALLVDLPSDRRFYKNVANKFLIKSTMSTSESQVEEPIDSFGDNDCKCSKTDSYCNAGNCRDNGCKTSSMGCGTLWLFTCNGVCSLL